MFEARVGLSGLLFLGGGETGLFKRALYLILKHLRQNNRIMTTWLKYMQSPVNPFRPEFTIVIFIHYKPRIAVAILHL